MSERLAIFTPFIGLRSETFILRHIKDLLPGRVVVVAGHVSERIESDAVPTLVLDQISEEPFMEMMLRLAARRFGRGERDYEEGVVRRFLREHEVTAVMGEYLNTFLPWFLLCKSLGLRTYVHSHGYDASMLFRSDYWKSQYEKYRDADGIITVNQIQRGRLISLGLDGARIHVIPCGVPVGEAPLARSDGDGTIRCLAVGRMVPKKAPILCLDAFRRAHLQMPNLRLDYVGEGDLLPSARRFVNAMEMRDCVTMHGGQPNVVVQKLMKTADIFLLHSVVDTDTGDEEGVPVSILEAMAQGLPVVSTRHAGIPEAVQHGETGYLVEEGDSRRMAQYIVELAGNVALRRSMGAEGWKRARNCFSLRAESTRLRSVMGVG